MNVRKRGTPKGALNKDNLIDISLVIGESSLTCHSFASDLYSYKNS